MSPFYFTWHLRHNLDCLIVSQSQFYFTTVLSKYPHIIKTAQQSKWKRPTEKYGFVCNEKLFAGSRILDASIFWHAQAFIGNSEFTNISFGINHKISFPLKKVLCPSSTFPLSISIRGKTQSEYWYQMWNINTALCRVLGPVKFLTHDTKKNNKCRVLYKLTGGDTFFPNWMQNTHKVCWFYCPWSICCGVRMQCMYIYSLYSLCSLIIPIWGLIFYWMPRWIFTVSEYFEIDYAFLRL